MKLASHGQPKPHFSLQDPHVSSPSPPVLLKGKALQIQMASMSPLSAQTCVLGSPESRQDLCQSPESCLHSLVHMD